jgi:hypothetical protein
MDNVYLNGSEDVARAGRSMQSAAADMLRAASSIEDTTNRQIRFMDDWLSRLGNVDIRAEIAEAVEDDFPVSYTACGASPAAQEDLAAAAVAAMKEARDMAEDSGPTVRNLQGQLERMEAKLRSAKAKNAMATHARDRELAATRKLINKIERELKDANERAASWEMQWREAEEKRKNLLNDLDDARINLGGTERYLTAAKASKMRGAKNDGSRSSASREACL